MFYDYEWRFIRSEKVPYSIALPINNQTMEVKDIALVPDTETIIYSAYVSLTECKSPGVKYREDMNVVGAWFSTMNQTIIKISSISARSL